MLTETPIQTPVLLLEDEPTVGAYVAEELTDRGIGTTSCASALELFDRLREEMFSVVILDINLENAPITIGHLLTAVEEHFAVDPVYHERLLDDLPATPETIVDGRYLLGLLHHIYPELYLIILTGEVIEKHHHFFREWGAYDFHDKLADPGRLEYANPDSLGMIDALVGTLEEIPMNQGVGGTAETGSGKGGQDSQVKRVAIPPPPETLNFERFFQEQRTGYLLENLLTSHIEQWPDEYAVRGEILYFNSEQRLLEQIAQVGFSSSQAKMVRQYSNREDFHDAGICFFVAYTRQSVLAPRVDYDRRYVEVVDQGTTVTELAVPLLLSGRLVGVLNLESSQPRAFTDRHLQYFESIAPQIAILIEHETYREEEELLKRAISSLAAMTEIEQILGVLLDHLLELVGKQTRGCVLMIDDQDSGAAVVLANRGLTLEVGERIEIQKLGVIRRALEDKKGYCYWSLEEGTEEYTSLAPETQSEYAKVLQMRDGRHAIVNLESPQIAISERFQRATDSLTEYVAARLGGLSAKSHAERQVGAESVLRALSHEMHTARGTFSILLQAQAELEPPENLLELSRSIEERLSNVQRMLKSFLEDVSLVDLSQTLQHAQLYARAIGVQLQVDQQVESPQALGTLPGFNWLFENLILNTKKHALSHQPPKAHIVLRENETHRLIQYWDNGRAPEPAERLLIGEHAGQGMRDILRLCQAYHWDVSTRRHEEGGLLYDFSYRTPS